jgi:hypothetical protein
MEYSFHIYISSKNPDGGIYPDRRKWPSIALEVGYTESYQQLLRDASLLLEGSHGKIIMVIIIKVDPMVEDEKVVTSGFVEHWSCIPHTFNRASRKRILKGRRKVRSILYLFSFKG